MRIRFRLKTLLVLIVVSALIAGYYGRRISLLGKEKQAVEQLSEDWKVRVNRVHMNDGLRYMEKSRIQNLIDWPINRWLGSSSKGNVKLAETDHALSLWLYEPGSREANSLAGLEHFTQLQELKLYDSPSLSYGVFVDDDEFQQIGKLEKLERLLMIRCRVGAQGLAHLSRLKLKHLRCGSGDWGQEELHEINKLTSLEELYVYCPAFDINYLANLTKLEKLEIYIREDAQLDGEEKLTSLASMKLRGFVFRDHIISLQKALRLESLEFMDFRLEDGCIDELLGLPSLKKIHFKYGEGISQPNRQKLEAAGIKVTVEDLPLS